jgi:uncharacterized protein YndB with AHSA1/START domain
MTPEPVGDVSVTRTFTVAPERVFDAWLDPAMIGQWMFGPRLRDEEVLGLDVNARVGGSFSFCVRRQGKELDHVGKYREIDRPRRLVFTWGVKQDTGDTSVVSVDIVPLAAGCKLTLIHGVPPEYAKLVEASWTKMLEALAATLATAKKPSV